MSGKMGEQPSEDRAGRDMPGRKLPKAGVVHWDPAAPRRLTLPPPYTQHRIDAGDVLDEALRRAPQEGAGVLVWRHGGGVLAFAVVLEPEQPLAQARMAFFAGMAALADALAAHCPPDRPVRFGYPDVVLYDAARLGGARFVTPEACREDEVPAWMVFAVELIAEREHLLEPGACPESTSLKEEEFEPGESIVESFASYLMLHFDRWTHQGLEAVIEGYMERLDPPMPAGARAIADGDLIERSASGETRRHGLADGLAACRWRGESGPKL